MTLLWPGFLPLFTLVPILVLLYWWILRRRRRFAVRYSSLSLIRQALPERSRWRRHLPAALFLLALTSLITALTRPAAQVLVPLSRTTIILAIDVSRSMCASDVPPNRLTVAQEAATKFVEQQADDTRIGIVAFADFAEVVVPPTNDKQKLIDALGSLTTSLGTAIGNATLKGLDAIASVNSAVAPSGVNLGNQSGTTTPAGSDYQPDIIVLLTDGANTRGPTPRDAAQQAADRHVRVYTIGFGTTQFSPMVCTSAQLGSDIFNGFQGGFGGGRFGGGGGFGRGGGPRPGRNYLLLDEPTLKAVADITGGTYYRAENADQLLKVFQDLPKQVALQKENIEVSVGFLALAALFVLLAVGLSMHWNRMP
jgi:Ca-activated chloride channel family protein